MADLRKLKDRAAELYAKGKLRKAAQAYRDVLAVDPRDLSSLQKMAEVLRRTGEIPEAVGVYRRVAELFAKDGFLIKAIAICKIILEIDPSHAETQAELAGLYARRGVASSVPDLQLPVTRRVEPIEVPEPAPEMEMEPLMASPEPEVFSVGVDDIVELPLPTPTRPPPLLTTPPPISAPPPPPPAPEPPVHAPPPMPAVAAMEPHSPPPAPVPLTRMISGELLGVTATPYETILAAASTAVASGMEEDVIIEGEMIDEPSSNGRVDELPKNEGAPVRLPRIPLFSDLAPRAFVALTEGASLRNVHPGEAIIREGETGTSFFVIATGKVRVEKKNDRGETILLARLGEGAFFGEMALLSGAPRAAAVIAEEEGQVLEFTADLLHRLCGEYPHLARSLTRFYRQRLIANTMATSPLFGPFEKVHRKELMKRFRSREVHAGDVVVREGEPADGLYVILSGAVDILKWCEDGEALAGKLAEGDVFGEMSCLTKGPASATVVASRPCTLLRLPREAFDEIVTSYPQVLELVSELADERARNLDAITSGTAEYTEDGLVLI